MRGPSLPELIKQYVYTRQSLSSDPEDPALLLRLAEICMLAMLYRSAIDFSERALALNPRLGDAARTAKSAKRVLDRAKGRHCIIAVDRAGSVLAADRVANRLLKFSSTGVRIWSVDREGFEDDALYRPDSLAVDPLGVSYVGSSALGRVQVFDPAGTFQRAFPVPKRFGPKVRIESLACDEAGNVWIMDSEAGLLRLVGPEGDELRHFSVEV